jgi:hypothetical protein
MTPIKFKKIELAELNELTGGLIYKINLDWYLNDGRKDILEYPDIFYRNSRSDKQDYTRFDLFQEDEDSHFILCPYYLELFEFNNIGHLIPYFIKNLCDKYKNKIVLFSWNHDNDFSKYHINLDKISNYRIINFGYIKNPTYKDILLPFWNVDTTYLNTEKQYFSSFIGSINNKHRDILVKNIEAQNSSDIKYFSTKNFIDYKKILGSSIFSLCPLGGPNDGGFSYRFFEVFHSGSIPVLIANNINFPYKDLDWTKLCVHLDINYVEKIEEMIGILKNIKTEFMIDYIYQNRLKFTLGGVQEEIFKNLNSCL